MNRENRRNPTFQKLHKVLRDEEETWKLKLQNSWLKSSDKNTTLFHRQAKARTIKNNVKEITMEDGIQICDI
jgi:hypothetical protein